MLGLINVLSSALGSPVLDKTDLKGVYSFKLEYTDPRFQRPGNGSDPAIDAPPDIFGAVQEQLGLKLEVKKGRSRSWSSTTWKKPPKTEDSKS